MTSLADYKATPKTVPIGIRLNNPGNIRYYNLNGWKGLDDPPQIDGYCNFVSPEWGIRAMMVLLSGWYRKRSFRFLRQVIDRYAPPSENPTHEYLKYVCDQVHIHPDDPIELDNPVFLIPVIKAMIRFENGPQHVKYDDGLYDLAAMMAGLTKEKENAG